MKFVRLFLAVLMFGGWGLAYAQDWQVDNNTSSIVYVYDAHNNTLNVRAGGYAPGWEFTSATSDNVNVCWVLPANLTNCISPPVSGLVTLSASGTAKVNVSGQCNLQNGTCANAPTVSFPN